MQYNFAVLNNSSAVRKTFFDSKLTESFTRLPGSYNQCRR